MAQLVGNALIVIVLLYYIQIKQIQFVPKLKI